MITTIISTLILAAVTYSLVRLLPKMAQFQRATALLEEKGKFEGDEAVRYLQLRKET